MQNLPFPFTSSSNWRKQTNPVKLTMISDHYCLQRRVAERGGDVETTFNTKNRQRYRHLLTNNLPAPYAQTYLVGWGWYWTPRLCEIVTKDEWDTINNIFCTQKHNYKTNTHTPRPKTPRPLLRFIRRQGRAERRLGIERWLWTVRRRHKKVGLLSR
jgi:hypothetical protein